MSKLLEQPAYKVASPYNGAVEWERLRPFREAFGLLYGCTFYEYKGKAQRRFFTINQLLAGSVKAEPKLVSQPGWQDHTECWLRDGKPYCFTEHLYGWDSKAAGCIEAAAEAGIRLIVPEMVSWYNPGETTLVIAKAA